MKKYYAVLAVFISGFAISQNAGSIDPTFNYRDQAPTINYLANSFLSPTEKPLLVRYGYKRYNEQETSPMGITRFNQDLSVDELFMLRGSGFNNINLVLAAAQQPDDKVLAAGTFTTYNGAAVKKIIRLDSSGNFDNSFDFSGYNTSTSSITNISKIGVLPDGKILIGGAFTIKVGALTWNGTARLNSNGSVDSTFPTGWSPFSKATLPSGKYFAVLEHTLSTGEVAFKVVRYNANNTLDATFTAITGFMSVCTTDLSTIKVIVQPDGKILVGGCFEKFNYLNDNGLKRFNADGTNDTTFNYPVNGVGINQTEDFLLMPDNTIRVIAAGVLKKLDATGAIVTAGLASDGIGGIEQMQLLADNNIMLRSKYLLWESENDSSPIYCDKLIRIDANHNILASTQGTGWWIGYDLLQKPDHTIVTLGMIQNRQGMKYHGGIRETDSNGQLTHPVNLHNGLNTPEIVYPQGNHNKATKGLFQPDGKLIVAQEYDQSAANNTITYGIRRFNADYSIDATFTPIAANTTITIEHMALQADGKLLVARDATLLRYNANGTPDTAFNTNTNTPNGAKVYAVAVQPDGKIIAAGSFDTFGTATVNKIIRLNADGTRDTTFSLPSSPSLSYIESLKILADGKILIGGKLFQNGTQSFNVARLNANGTVDTGFTKPSYSSRTVRSMVVQPDGKIIAVLNSSNIVPEPALLARFNADGTTDATFSTGAGFNGDVHSILLQPDGKVIATGDFTKFNNIFCNGTVRLLGASYVIQGQNKFDANNNGCTAADANFPNLKLRLTANSQTMDFIPDVSGNYNIPVGPGTYSVTPVFPSGTFLSASPSTASVTFPGSASPFVQNFCITGSGIHNDLEVVLISLNDARPGTDAKYKIVYKNKGNQTQSGSVNLAFNDAALDLVSALPAANTAAANSLTWNFSGLLPFETREILFAMNLNSPTETPPLTQDSILNYTATVTSAAADETPIDNTFVRNQVVTNSFDPNDKTCLQGHSIATSEVGKFVHYVIRFENTGTAAAQNIVVKDVIDTSKFEISTLEPVSGSHLFVTRITDGNQVEFRFNDINLGFTDATNDGYVAFKIKTKASLTGGSYFSNAASIYFDYNYAIETNTATTYIGTLATQDYAPESPFTVYPNPANEVLNIYSKAQVGLDSIAIYNVMGQLVLAIPNARGMEQIDISQLKTGNYVMKIHSEKGMSSVKFVKK